ncbi:helix-hairpin-helix domain-containing protein [Streptomyces sp. NPDC088794]|uniref:helix-hairpin-helix domain-containing protein n=1 Tax=Streptomyces sp. NPDC088794 TaxID=3365902 RepID=UPI00382D8953
MSTEPETTEETEPGTPGGVEPGGAVEGASGEEASVEGESGASGEGESGAAAEGVSESSGDGTESAGGDSEAGGEGETGETGEGSAAEGKGDADADGEAARQKSEAEAELAAQRIERERIERRKAEKQGPIAAGTKLSGTAADLLAAVRAVESGEKPVAVARREPPAPRRPDSEPVRRPQPAPAAAAPMSPGTESVDAVRRVLTEGGAPDALAPQVAAALGEGAEDQLRADPWLLLRVGAVRPEQADGFARALLGAECGPDDERRGRALTGWLLEQAALAGHTALEMPALTAALTQRGVPDPDAAVQSTVAEGEALVFEDALDPTAPVPASASASAGHDEGEGDGEDGEGAERPVRVLIGLERYALAEESLADGLARVINSVPKEDGSAEEWERAAGAAKGSTAELLRAVAGHALVLHTGGEASLVEPAALLDAATGLGLRSWAAAHSVIGRDRFAERLTGAGSPNDAASDGSSSTEPPTGGSAADDGAADSPVATVAGLLSGTEGPGRDGEGALDLDLLVVLDAPQLDVESAALLVESLPDGARLVLAGDPAGLWSAGPGRVFADLLAARVCPSVASRVPDPGPLGELVSGVGIGELNQVEAPGKEVVIVPVRDAGEAVHRTVQLVADSVPRAIGVPAEQTQVITPGHGGAAGTRALNAALKERLNPGPGRFGGFDPGDRIAYSPAPGRSVPGRVVTADADGLHLSVSGAPVVVPKEQVEQSVRHGWALTAHQAVGAHWPAVVVVLPGDAAQALSRPWVYTAFGRADRHLSVVHGVEQALARAVSEVPPKPRTTRLPVLLAPQVPVAAAG